MRDRRKNISLDGGMDAEIISRKVLRARRCTPAEITTRADARAGG
jgi:hypothetical protein